MREGSVTVQVRTIIILLIDHSNLDGQFYPPDFCVAARLNCSTSILTALGPLQRCVQQVSNTKFFTQHKAHPESFALAFFWQLFSSLSNNQVTFRRCFIKTLPSSLLHLHPFLLFPPRSESETTSLTMRRATSGSHVSSIRLFMSGDQMSKSETSLGPNDQARHNIYRCNSRRTLWCLQYPRTMRHQPIWPERSIHRARFGGKRQKCNLDSQSKRKLSNLDTQRPAWCYWRCRQSGSQVWKNHSHLNLPQSNGLLSK